MEIEHLSFQKTMLILLSIAGLPPDESAQLAE